MTILEFIHQLRTFTPEEKYLREYYLSNGTYHPVNETLAKVINGTIHAPLENKSEASSPINPDTLFHNGFFTSKDIPIFGESLFINENDDIVLEKHVRFFYPLPHRHEFFEFIYVLEGSCANLINDVDIHMKKGDLCILPPQVIHSISVNSDSIIVNLLIRNSTFHEVFNVIQSDNHVLAKYFNDIRYSTSFHHYLMFKTGNDESIANYIVVMYMQQNESKAFHQIIIDGLFVALCGTLMQSHEKDILFPNSFYEQQNIMPIVVNYIKNNYIDITLTQVAEHFHMSPQYLSRKIKQFTSRNFQDILTEIKMENAIKLLDFPDLTINSIGEKLGYSDSNYFMKVFKKNYGCTPSEYRDRKKR